MATSAISDVIDALVAQAQAALPNITVYDGQGLDSGEDDSFLMIGVADPDQGDGTIAATADQTWAHVNHTAKNESGEILCAAVFVDTNPSASMATARQGAFATTAAVENMLRSNPTLGLATLLWTSFGQQVRLSQNQAENGAIAIVYFQIQYQARI